MAGYTAVPALWQTSGRKLVNASNQMASAVHVLCDRLEVAGRCWGKDDIGRAFFNGDDKNPGFGDSRHLVLSALAETVNRVRAGGGALWDSGRIYARAEQAGTIGGDSPAVTGTMPLAPYRLPSTETGPVASDPEPVGPRGALRCSATSCTRYWSTGR